MQGGSRNLVSKQVTSSRLFFLEESGGEFAVVMGGYERCGTDYRVERSGFPWHVLELVDEGEGKVVLDGEQYALHAGGCFLYGPHTSHRIESTPAHPLGKYFVAFTGTEVPEILDESGLSAGWVGHARRGDGLRRAFELLVERGIRKTPRAGDLCRLMARQLLLLCGDDAARSVDFSSPAYQTYHRAKIFMEREFASYPTLAKLAAACEVDSAYLCRLFGRFHDESPYQYLLRLRMELAARLLLEPGSTVKAVASQMGYSDAFHFSRVFKSVHRVPPSRFRFSAPDRPRGLGLAKK